MGTPEIPKANLPTLGLGRPIVSPVLIGRARELERLERALAAAAGGTGQCIFVSGEAGVGKSRLLGEAAGLAAKRGFARMEGCCFEQDAAFPYAPWLDALRGWMAARGPSAQRELARVLPELAAPGGASTPPSDRLSPEAEKRRLFEALAHVLTRQSEGAPLLIALEDMHWSDETSLDFLHFFARRLATSTILLIATYRSEEAPARLLRLLAQFDRERRAEEIHLRPLARADAEAMVRAIFDIQRPIRAEFLDIIVPLTEGNPFFVEEILKALVEAGDIFYANGQWERKDTAELHIPRRVLDAVRARVAPLGERARRVLELAAVAGRRFDFNLLREVMSMSEPELLEVMKALVSAQIVVEETADRFAFRHALTREAAYSTLLVRERKRYHAIIAETLERMGSTPPAGALLGELAYHYYQAGAWEKALEYAQKAGERARSLYAQREAVQDYSRALEAARALGHTAPGPLLHARAQAQETLGDFEAARSDYEAALAAAREAHEVEAESQGLMALGFLWAGRDYQRTGDLLRQASQLAQTLPDNRLYAHSLNRLGNWFVNTGRVDEGLELHRQALAIFEGWHDKQGLAATHDLLGTTLSICGDIVQSQYHFDKAILMMRELDDKRGLVSSLILSRHTSYINETLIEPEPALEEEEHHATEAMSLARQIGWLDGQAFVGLGYGPARAMQGNLGAGLALSLEALRIAQEIGHRQWMAGAHDAVGYIYILLLHAEHAIETLERGLQVARELKSVWWTGSLTTNLALASLMNAEPDRAREVLEAAWPRDRQPRVVPERQMARAWAEWSLANGEPEVALRMADALTASAPGAGASQPIPVLLALRADALLALGIDGARGARRARQAEQALLDARRGAEERRQPSLRRQIHTRLGRLYQVMRRADDAEAEFAAARAIVESLAATIGDEALRGSFVQAALAASPKERPGAAARAARREFGGLTGREREVAVLVARGQSNREIAAALVVSERTVETHIGNILGKLGFTTRAQVRKWAHEKGL